MATKKRGIFSKLIEGPERSEDYARKTLPSNRWALGWDLIKGNLGKLLKINLLIMLFIFPIFLVLWFRFMLIEGQSLLAPFAQNLGIGYPAYPNVQGLAESIIMQSDFICFVLLLVLSFYFNIGIAGGFYVIRNLVWTEGVFVSADFWTGVKKNYKDTLPHTFLFVIFLALSVISIDLSNLSIALDPSKSVLLTISKIVSYILMFLIICIYLFSLTLTVTYKNSFFNTLRNAFILMIGLLPLNLFFMALSLVSFVLLLFEKTTIIFSIGIIVAIFLSFSISILIWTNYSQWAFDECINDRIAGAKKNRGIYKQDAKPEIETFVYKKTYLTSKPVKPITDYDVEIVALPESYSRADLIRLEESKKRMIEDSDKYVEEHKNDYKEEENKVEEFMSKPKNNKKGK